MKRRHSINFTTLAWTLLLPLAVGMIGSLFTVPAVEGWYATLEKPFYSPPNWVFGPVWTVLYVLMGIALYLVMTAKSKASKQVALSTFLGQLGLNLLWSIIFFGAQLPILALLEIIVLFVAIILTIRAFAAFSQIAAWLLVPYAAWVGFAMLLNAGIVYLN